MMWGLPPVRGRRSKEDQEEKRLLFLSLIRWVLYIPAMVKGQSQLKKINVKYMKKIINSKRLKVPPKKKLIDLGGGKANK